MLMTTTRAMGPFAAALLTLTILSAGAAGAPVVWSAAQGGNGHSYEVVVNDTISWSGARDAASAAGGYLATETSAAEQQFVDSVLAAAAPPTGAYWFGLHQVAGAGAGAYAWDNGEPLAFTHWDAGEPNAYLGIEDSGGVLWTTGNGATVGRRGTWNDVAEAGYPSQATTQYPDLGRAGFVVERDAATAASVPLPQAAYLFGSSAALALACWRRARRCP
jgi:hypothetical protein